MDNRIYVPIHERYTMTIPEASAYFNIGEQKLRRILSENQNATFVLHNGSRTQIKRKKFEEYIDRCDTI